MGRLRDLLNLLLHKKPRLVMPKIDAQENLRLRSEYRKKAHKLWSNSKNGDEYWVDARAIKNELLMVESNEKRRFYRYKSFFDWDNERFESEISDIEQRKLILMSPLRFNDPYDCRIPASMMKSWLSDRMASKNKFKRDKEILKLINQQQDTFCYFDMRLTAKERRGRRVQMKKNVYESMKNKIHTEDGSEQSGIRSNIPVTCFSITPNDMYFWSHYGGIHKGYCIEYEFSEKLFGEKLHPVEYVSSWPKDFLELSKNGSNVASALIKSDDWSKEYEWRLMADFDASLNGGFRKISLPEGLKISRIYLGLNFYGDKDDEMEKRRALLLKACKNAEIDTCQVELNKDGFGFK
jgi:hypothetical protein